MPSDFSRHVHEHAIQKGMQSLSLGEGFDNEN